MVGGGCIYRVQFLGGRVEFMPVLILGFEICFIARLQAILELRRGSAMRVPIFMAAQKACDYVVAHRRSSSLDEISPELRIVI